MNANNDVDYLLQVPNGSEGQYHRMSRDAGVVAKERRRRRKDPSPARPLANDSYHFLRQQHRNIATHFRYSQLHELLGGAARSPNDDDDDPPSTIV